MKRRPSRTRAGFTLLELLVVLAILGLIGGIVGVQVVRSLGTAKSETAKLQMQQIATAMDLFRLDVGRYPSQQEGLRALVERPGNASRWNGPYLKSSVPNDPWDKPFVFRIPGQGGREFDLLSLGADGVAGGTGEAADVVLK